MFSSSLKDIKKMFACEHVTVVGMIGGTKYFYPKTNKPMSRRKALKILEGDY